MIRRLQERDDGLDHVGLADPQAALAERGGLAQENAHAFEEEGAVPLLEAEPDPAARIRQLHHATADHPRRFQAEVLPDGMHIDIIRIEEVGERPKPGARDRRWRRRRGNRGGNRGRLGFRDHRMVGRRRRSDRPGGVRRALRRNRGGAAARHGQHGQNGQQAAYRGPRHGSENARYYAEGGAGTGTGAGVGVGAGVAAAPGVTGLIWNFSFRRLVGSGASIAKMLRPASRAMPSG